MKNNLLLQPIYKNQNNKDFNDSLYSLKHTKN